MRQWGVQRMCKDDLSLADQIQKACVSPALRVCVLVQASYTQFLQQTYIKTTMQLQLIKTAFEG